MFDYCIVCACLGIEGSKERLLGDLYHSSPLLLPVLQVFVLGSRSGWIEADGEGMHTHLDQCISVLDLCGHCCTCFVSRCTVYVYNVGQWALVQNSCIFQTYIGESIW